MTNPVSLQDWSSQGWGNQGGQEFAQNIMSLNGLKVFAKGMPAWSQRYNTTPTLTLTAPPQAQGVVIELSFNNPSLPVVAVNELLDRLHKVAELVELEDVIEHFNAAQIDPCITNALVDKANALATQLKAQEKAWLS